MSPSASLPSLSLPCLPEACLGEEAPSYLPAVHRELLFLSYAASCICVRCWWFASESFPTGFLLTTAARNHSPRPTISACSPPQHSIRSMCFITCLPVSSLHRLSPPPSPPPLPPRCACQCELAWRGLACPPRRSSPTSSSLLARATPPLASPPSSLHCGHSSSSSSTATTASHPLVTTRTMIATHSSG